MLNLSVKINSILGGISPSPYFGRQDQYGTAIGIDPDFPATDTGSPSIKIAGSLRPVALASFDGANVNANPYWLITNPKNSNVYTFLNNGRFISYTSALGSETLVGTASSSSGNGAAYYSNYIYLATNTNISRYGPLDGTPALTDSVWTGSTLGSQTALVNSTYPSIRGSGTMPNHPMHFHVDNKLYFGDFDSTSSTVATRGRGLIHFIQTKFGSAEGDTNNGSTYNALDLPLGFMPTALESFDLDLVIGAIQGSNTVLDQGKAALFFWDTTSSSFYRQVEFPEPIISALLYKNGVLYVWGGKMSTSGGHGLYIYLGGSSFKKVATVTEGHPPLAGAIDGVGNRVSWGSWQTYPTNSACVYSFGSKDGNLPATLHNTLTANASASSTDGVVTTLKYAEQRSDALPAPIIGWRDATNFGLDSLSTTYQTSPQYYWDSQIFSFGKRGVVKKIILNFAQSLTTNQSLIPDIIVDDISTTNTLTTINSTNYSGRRVVLYPNITFNHNFFLRLRHTGTVLLTTLLPITIEVETLEP